MNIDEHQNKNRINSNKGIVVIIEASWGQLEWILPVLSKLREIDADIVIAVFFSPTFISRNKDKTDSLMLSLLKEITNYIYWCFNEENIEQAVTSLNSVNIKVILKESSVSIFAKKVQKIFYKALVIGFPDGPHFRVYQKFNSTRYCNRWEKLMLDQDIMFADTDLAAPYLFEMFPDARMFFTGTPKLDSEWVIKLISQKDFLSSSEMEISSRFSKVFLFITTFSHPLYKYFPKDIQDYVTSTVIDYILSDPDNLLIIKPHPRQEISSLLSFVTDYNKNQLLISNIQVVHLAALSDFVISVSSSAILSALSVKRPVVIFHPYVWPSHALSVDRFGRLYSQYDMLNVSVYAKSGKDLKSYIQDYFNPDSDHSIWINQMQAYNKLIHHEVSSSHYTAMAILKALHDENINPIYTYETPKNRNCSLISPQTHQLELTLNKMNSYMMPISTKCIKEMANGLKLENIVLTGSVNEYLVNESSKIFDQTFVIEASSDLYQFNKFNFIKNNEKIELMTSSKILEHQISKISNKSLIFWLDSHEIAIKTFKTKTQTPVIEELKVIQKYYRSFKKVVIVINNLKFFQPVKPNVDEARGQKERCYPSLKEVMHILKETDTNLEFFVLGNIGIIYSSPESIAVTDGVRACTISRLFENEENIEDVLSAEKYISQWLINEERKAVRDLFDEYTNEEDWMVGGHFVLWRALINMGEKKYNNAINDFTKAIHLGCHHWRVLWYIAQSAYLNGNIKLSMIHLNKLIKIVPNFQPVVNLYHQLI